MSRNTEFPLNILSLLPLKMSGGVTRNSREVEESDQNKYTNIGVCFGTDFGSWMGEKYQVILYT
jgi:hypothetical protein